MIELNIDSLVLLVGKKEVERWTIEQENIKLKDKLAELLTRIKELEKQHG